jgi:single-strand DNA-binding protein
MDRKGGKIMAGSLNRVMLIGNLGKDPETRSFANGGQVVSMTIATSETWRDKASGDRKTRTEWHSISILNEPIGKIAAQYLRKGSKVYIEGQLETRKWTDKAGVEKYSTEIVLRPFNGALTLLDGKADGGDAQGNSGQSEAQGEAQGGYGAGDMDDEIPF